MHTTVSKKVELLKQVNELSAVRNDLASEVINHAGSIQTCYYACLYIRRLKL